MSNINNLEERIEKPGYLLMIVTVLLFLILGWVNLLTYESKRPAFFDQYSVPFMAVIIGYAVATLVWAGLLFRPNDDRWLDWVVRFAQRRPIIGLGIFAGISVLLWTLFTRVSNFDLYWFNFPALQFTIFLLVVLVVGFILFYGWNERPVEAWRRFIVYGLIAFVAVEIVVQGIAFAGLLPTITTTLDSFPPFARVYHKTDDILVNTTMNANGMLYPELRLEEDSYRVMLLGDASIQALEIEPEEHMGVWLDAQMTASGVRPEGSELFPMPHPDYGPGVYANVPLFIPRQEVYDPDEVILFFDMRNDFQMVNATNGHEVYFFLEDGVPTVDGNTDKALLHAQLHEALWGQDGFMLNRWLRSHFLLPQLIGRSLRPDVALADVRITGPQEDLAIPNSFAFYEDLNDDAMAMAIGHLDVLVEHALTDGLKISLVTIPAFPTEFYAQGDTVDWTTTFGAADLFLPERELADYAASKGIPFLGMGEYLTASGLSVEQLRDLYRENGLGQLSPEGHALFAEAVFDCVLAEEGIAGCQ